MNLTVRQHIFGNVPKEQSPRGRRGFQTIYATQGLTPEEVLLLEERAQYHAGDTQPVKYQFHTLPGDQAVVSQIVAVAEPDEYGRKGRYLAHSLIVAAVDFRRLAYCPLPLIVSGHFVADMATALAAGDRATGELPAKPLTVADADSWAAYTTNVARQWPPVELEALARLGWQAAAARRQRQVVALTGHTDEMLRALSVCFLLCSPEKRAGLTFDTYAYRCDWGRDRPFWALGKLEETAETAYRIDGTARRVYGRLPDGDDTPFERWVARIAIPEHLEYLSAYEEDARRLTAVLAGSGDDVSGMDPTFGRQFAQLNAATVVQRVLARFPSELGQARRERLQRRIQADPWSYLARLPQGFGLGQMAAELIPVETALLRSRAAPADAELRALSQLAATAGDEELNALLLLWGKDRDAWRGSLARLPVESYRRVVAAAISAGVVAPAEAFVVEHLPAWSETVAPAIRPGELKSVLRAIDKQGRQPDVDGLQWVWGSLNQEDRLLLTEWLRRYPGPALVFRANLGLPEPEPPGGRSLLGRLRAPFSRKTDPDGDHE